MERNLLLCVMVLLSVRLRVCGSIDLSVCLCVYVSLCVCLSVCVSVCLSVCLSVYPAVSLWQHVTNALSTNTLTQDLTQDPSLPLLASQDKPWWSYDIGLIHFVGMSTEHDFRVGSEQHTW